MPSIAELVDGVERIQVELESTLPVPLRPWNEGERLSKLRGAIVVGARGVGKTTQLLSLGRRRGRCLYVSVDHLALAGVDLSALSAEAWSRGYEGIVLDEVHAARDWPGHLKSILDSSPRKFVWASDSNASVLRASTADLSRRFPRLDLPPLSFREYLVVSGGPAEPVHAAFGDLGWARELVLRTNVLAGFRAHVRGGMRPFFVEGEYADRLLATVEKTVHVDVPAIVPSVQEQHFRLVKAVLRHLAQSTVPTVNVDGLCRGWAIGKEKLYGLLDALEATGLLHIVRYAKDKAVLTKGAKLLLADPSLYAVLGGDEGTMREAYVVTQARAAGLEVFAAPDETKGDFVVGGRLVEVGGRGKRRTKAEFVVRADVELPSPGVLPLWTVGFWR